MTKSEFFKLPATRKGLALLSAQSLESKFYNEVAREGAPKGTINKRAVLSDIEDGDMILCPDKMMLDRAMQIERMAEQESNLVYVAYTRAKSYLGFITDYE